VYPGETRSEQPRPRLRQRGALGLVVELLETLVLVATIYALVNLASARFIVDGDSMLPNFHTGEFILISRVNYLFAEPQRGDIVVFHYPLDPESDFIKRVIGLPGDSVEIRDTRVYVNGVALEEPYINEPCLPVNCPDEMWTLGADEFFVMGDNRNRSRDSRAFDAVHRRFLVGEALVRYWPPGDWGVVNQLRFPGENVSQ
jgi:signal peptidase I